MKKIIVALALVATAVTAQARTSAKDCENYGDIVGMMQDIRNKGAGITVATREVQNLVTSSSALERDYGKSLTEIAQYIWSKPQGNMTQSHATNVGTMVCNEKYRK